MVGTTNVWDIYRVRFNILSELGKMMLGNGPLLVSETVRTTHKCRFLGHAIVNVSTVQHAHPAVNIYRSRKDKIFYNIEECKKKKTLKKKKPFFFLKK